MKDEIKGVEPGRYSGDSKKVQRMARLIKSRDPHKPTCELQKKLRYEKPFSVGTEYNSNAIPNSDRISFGACDFITRLFIHRLLAYVLVAIVRQSLAIRQFPGRWKKYSNNPF